MHIQVFKTYNLNIDACKGVAVAYKNRTDRAIIVINMDVHQTPEERQKTLRHELWHCLSGDVLRGDDPDGKAEEDAKRHEEDVTLDGIISAARLWENAICVDAQKPTELVYS